MYKDAACQLKSR